MNVIIQVVEGREQIHLAKVNRSSTENVEVGNFQAVLVKIR